MVFNSWQFVGLFLPVTWIIYFVLNKGAFPKSVVVGWLVFSSLFFYFFAPGSRFEVFIPCIVVSFFVAILMEKWRLKPARFRGVFWLGIIFNVGTIVWFKYAHFFSVNLRLLVENFPRIESKELPLGISFFVFQKIAYLVDIYKGGSAQKKPLYFMAFVTFFPQMIAGPITHHSEIFGQLKRWSHAYSKNLAVGLSIFILGLGKKVLIADRLAGPVSAVFFGQTVVLIQVFFKPGLPLLPTPWRSILIFQVTPTWRQVWGICLV